jgi:hypothetical protein
MQMKRSDMKRHLQQMLIAATLGVSGLEYAQGADNTYSWVGLNLSNSASWTPVAHWAGGVAPPSTPAVGDRTIVYFGGTLSSNGSLHNGEYELHQIIVDDMSLTTGSLNITSSGGSATVARVLRLGAGGIRMNTTTNTGAVNLSAGGSSFDRRLLLTADQEWYNGNLALGGTGGTSATNLIVRRVIDDGDSDFKIIKTGVGTLQITTGVPNTWSGGLDLNEGQLRLDTSNVGLLGTGTVTVGTANSVGMSASGTAYTPQTLNNKFVLSGGGTLSFRGSWEYNLNGEINFAGDKFIGINAYSDPQAGSTTFNGPVTGTGKFTKGNSGTLVFNSDASGFSGDLAVATGYLSIGTLAQLGTSTNPVSLGNSDVLTPIAGVIVVRTTGTTSTTRGFATNVGGGEINAVGSVSIGNVTGTGAFTKSNTGSMSAGSIRVAASIAVTGGNLTLNPDGSDAASNHATDIILAGATDAWTSKLDVNNNDTVVEYASASPLAAVTNQIKQGYASGSWNGNGITSTAAATQSTATHKTALGVGEATDLGLSSFAGQTLAGNAVLIAYTWSGDATLDGKVNTLDFNRLAAGFGGSGGWTNGDFNYSGNIDSTDFSAMVANYGLSTAPAAPSLGAVVPEPTGLALVGILAGIARRRRR